MRISFLFCLFAPAAFDGAAPVAARQPTQVLIIGMVHLDNPGRDVVNPEIKDVLGQRRQKEIMQVVEGLKAFGPTKIALEALPGSAVVEQRLAQYLGGSYRLTADERDQLGLRIAKEAKLVKVFGIDSSMDLDFDGMFRYAEKNGQNEVVQNIMSEVESKIKPKFAVDYLEKHSIGEILREANSPDTDAVGHRIYMGALRIGKGKDYPGADLVARWYQRNLLIASNIARLSDGPGERILVLIGAGHGKLLRQFLAETPGFEVVDCSKYLQ